MDDDRAIPSRAVEATVCIATHRRPQGLERLLASLVDQEGAPPFDVVVIDNDAQGSAAPIVARFAAALAITYQVEPTRGLARVRNRAVAAATGTFIAFIDDDEWAAPDWLAALHRRARELAADVVIGPVQVIFDEATPPEIRTCGVFDPAPVGDGERVPWWFTRTGNAYVRRAALARQPGPFSEAFNLTGGEDVDLFRRMIAAGAVIVAVHDAVVHEYRPSARANFRWLMRRAARDGHNKAFFEWADRPLGARLVLGLFAVATAARAAVLAAWNWRWRRGHALAHAMRGAGAVGKLAFLAGIPINEYRDHS